MSSQAAAAAAAAGHALARRRAVCMAPTYSSDHSGALQREKPRREQRPAAASSKSASCTCKPRSGDTLEQVGESENNTAATRRHAMHAPPLLAARLAAGCRGPHSTSLQVVNDYLLHNGAKSLKRQPFYVARQTPSNCHPKLAASQASSVQQILLPFSWLFLQEVHAQCTGNEVHATDVASLLAWAQGLRQHPACLFLSLTCRPLHPLQGLHAAAWPVAAAQRRHLGPMAPARRCCRPLWLLPLLMAAALLPRHCCCRFPQPACACEGCRPACCGLRAHPLLQLLPQQAACLPRGCHWLRQEPALLPAALLPAKLLPALLLLWVPPPVRWPRLQLEVPPPGTCPRQLAWCCPAAAPALHPVHLQPPPAPAWVRRRRARRHLLCCRCHVDWWAGRSLKAGA